MIELNLPFVKNATKEIKIDELSLKFNDSIYVAISKLCNNSDIAIYIFLTSVTKILLYKYNCQEKLPLIIPSLNNQHQAPLSITEIPINKNSSFKELLSIIKESIVSYYNKVAVYQTQMNSSDLYEMDHTTILCLSENIHNVNGEDSKVDFCYIFSRSDSLKVSIRFNSNKYNYYIVKQMLTHLQHICKDVISNNYDIIVKDIKILSPQELNTLSKFNDNKINVPNGKSVYHHVDDWAKLKPDKTAIKYNNQLISYHELSEKSISLANHLLKHNIKKSEIVGILMPRSVDMVISILALWRLGASYMPISINEPVARMNQILEHAGVVNILVSNNLKYTGNANIINVDRQNIPINQRLIETSFDIHDLAYVIFTSGSTGRPKGVMIEHLGMMNNLLTKVRTLPITSDSIVAQTASHTFDISVFQSFAPLLVGGEVIIYSNDEVKDIETFIKKIEAQKVNILQVVPSYFNVLHRICNTTKTKLSHLQILLSVGEALIPELAQKWQNLYPGIKMINCYGPTETSDNVCQYLLPDNFNYQTVSVGNSMQNTDVYVVNSNAELCPIGCKGEIWVSGYGVARGYINDLERTAQSFCLNPFLKEGNSRLYKTGDIGCWTPEGDILFFGRQDLQVKIRGHRIELDEIKNVILKQKEILNAEVFVENQNTENVLVTAYIVPAQPTLDIAGVMNTLSDYLPSYMLPNCIIAIDALPLTPHGKIDRKKLIEIKNSKSTSSASTLTDLHYKVIEIIKSVLDYSYDIYPETRFFEIGGNSLSAIIFLSKLEELLGVKISLNAFMNNSKLSDIITIINKNKETTKIRIPNSTKSDKYKALKKQETLFLIQDKINLTYNMPTLLKLKGDFEIERFNTALHKLISRHEALRTRFELIDNILFQVIEDSLDYNTEIIESSNLKLDQIIKNFIKPFNLTHAPLFRVGIVPDFENTTLLLIDIHHIITDGISNKIMLKDLVNLYQGNELPALTHQFRDYSEWYQNNISANKLENIRKYWLERLGAEKYKLALPYDNINPDDFPTFNGDRITFTISTEQYDKINELSLRYNTTRFNILMAVHNILLSKICNQEEIRVGVVSAGRHYSEFEDVMGMFTNMILFKCQLDQGMTFEDFHNDCKNSFIQDLSNSVINVEELLLNKISTESVFLLQNYNTKIESDNILWEVISYNRNVSRFNLIFMGIDINEKLEFEVQFNKQLFASNTISEIIRYYLKILDAILSNPQIKLNTILLLEEADSVPSDLDDDNFHDI